MQYVSRLVLYLALLCSVLACTSLHEKAAKHYEAGEFLAASSLYSQILNREPSDPIAIERLQRSRQNLIQERLIEVRQQRMSDNFLEALSKLDQILKDENSWKVSPSGLAYATQNEEADLLFQWVNRQALDDVEHGKYLKAKLFIEKQKSIFEVGVTRKKFSNLWSKINNQGSSHCQSMKSIGGGPYSKEFITKYCMVWESKENKNDREPSSAAISGFGQIALDGKIKNLPVEVLSSLSESLLAGLKTTPFYKPDAAPLRVFLAGSFASNYNEHQTVVIHSYQVQIPYQIMISVPYTESQPYTAYRTEYNYATQQNRQVAYTAYNYVTKYRQQSITRYRSEARSQPYASTEFNVGFLIVGKATVNLDNTTHQIPLDEQLNYSDTYHETENSEIGLHSKPKRVPAAVDWLKEKFGESGTKFGDRIVAAWDARYCQVPKNLMAKTQIESVMKCIKGTRTEHEFVENWFESKFGLPYAEVKNAIGLGV